MNKPLRKLKTGIKYFLLRNIRCPKCGYIKFRTMIKGKSWKCRACGEVINV